MEDSPPNNAERSKDEVELDSDSKGNFFETWLKFLRGPEIEGEKGLDLADEHSEKEKPKTEKRWKKFGNKVRQLIIPTADKDSAESRLSSLSHLEESPEEERTITLEKLPEIEVKMEQLEGPGLSGQSGPERVGEIANRVDAPGFPALASAEYLHRRHTKNNRELAKLKKEAKSVKKEKAEFRHQQEEFEKKLDYKIRQDETIKQRPGTTAFELAHSPNLQRDKTIEKPLSGQDLKNILSSEPTEKPQVVTERVEAVAAHDLPIESLFKRRHELKDSSVDKSVHASAQPLTPFPSGGLTRSKTEEQPKRPILNPIQDKPWGALKPTNARPALYKQAITSGFWTAVVLLAGVFVLVLLS